MTNLKTCVIIGRQNSYFKYICNSPSKLSFLLIAIHSKMKEQVKFQNGVNASIDKWSMLSARRKKRLMIRSATVVGAVVLVWRVDHCTKNLISCRLRVWTICLCYQNHIRLQYIDFTCWKAEICIIGILMLHNIICNRSFSNLFSLNFT